jgi:acyl-coenzyme A synthetase/AMP-(fatty) acid ligase
MTVTAFTTSGSTGEPVSWLRTREQVLAEVDLIAELLVGDVDEVVCSAPPQHLFGHLFGTVLPAERGLPVQWLHADPFAVPRLAPGRRVLIICVPSTWVLLRRLVPELSTLDFLVLLHGTGPTTPSTDDVMGRLPTAVGQEIFGSTETGAVGHRRIAPAWSRTPWTLLPDVTMLADDDDGYGPAPAGRTQRLTVASPRLARPDDASSAPMRMRTDDMVRVLEASRFEHLGRASRLLKVNGRRCNLDQLEQLAQLLLGRPVACVPVRDRVRGEHYELFYEGSADEAEAWHRLAPLAATGPVPRSVRAVPSIPRTAVGKIKIDQLYAQVGGAR